MTTSESWRDKQTHKEKERTEWHRVVIFGKLAEIAGEYLRKGSQVYIEGQLQTRKWQDNSGVDRWTTEIVVKQQGTLQMLGSRANTSGQGQPAAGNNRGQQPPAVPSHSGALNQWAMNHRWMLTKRSRFAVMGMVSLDMRYMRSPKRKTLDTRTPGSPEY